MERKTLKEVMTIVGKESARYSAEAVNKVTTALLNEVDYETETVKTVKGEKVVEKIKPVKELRETLAGIISKAGVDEADAKKFMEDYQFKGKEGAAFVPVAKAIVNENLKTGKVFKLSETDECVATLRIKHVEAGTKEHRNPKTGDVIKIKTAAHDRVVVKSPAPKAKKSRVK
jgi:hypothetical protein